MRREATIEWIVEQVDTVFDTYPKAEADAAMPVLILMLLRDFPADELDPRIQREGEAILVRAGVTVEMTAEQVARRVNKYLATLPVHDQLLGDIKRVFDVHQEALAEETRSGYRRLIGHRNKTLPPMLGAERPPNTERVQIHAIRKRM
jgi:hypothetical protein